MARPAALPSANHPLNCPSLDDRMRCEPAIRFPPTHSWHANRAASLSMRTCVAFDPRRSPWCELFSVWERFWALRGQVGQGGGVGRRHSRPVNSPPLARRARPAALRERGAAPARPPRRPRDRGRRGASGARMRPRSSSPGGRIPGRRPSGRFLPEKKRRTSARKDSSARSGRRSPQTSATAAIPARESIHSERSVHHPDRLRPHRFRTGGSPWVTLV